VVRGRHGAGESAAVNHSRPKLKRDTPNKRINLMRPSAEVDWERTAHRLCAVR